jgi:pantothenate synthetase
VQVLDAENLNPVPTVAGERDAVIAVAAKFGSVRLLDNIAIGGEGTR